MYVCICICICILLKCLLYVFLIPYVLLYREKENATNLANLFEDERKIGSMYAQAMCVLMHVCMYVCMLVSDNNVLNVVCFSIRER